MANTPYGYQIEDGLAVLDNEGSLQIQRLFEAYIGGAALNTAAKMVGINKTHSAIAGMLRNKKYLGTEFYPAIIDRQTFDAAQEVRQNRANALGRNFEYQKEQRKRQEKYNYHLGRVDQKFENPFRQAEYAYSLIESVRSDE